MSHCYEAYRDFTIELTITDNPTTWDVETRVGVFKGDDFVLDPRIAVIKHRFQKTDGAINCGIETLAQAKQKIDEHERNTIS